MSERRSLTPRSWWWTTAVLTARPRSSRTRPRAWARCTCCPARPSSASVAPTGTALAGDSSATSRSLSRWTRTSATTPMPFRRSSRPSRTAMRCPSARAMSPADRYPTGACRGGCSRGAATSMRISLLGLGVRDSTAGFRAYAASVLRRHRAGSVRAESYGFQIEMTYRGCERGRQGQRGADPFCRPRARDLEDVHLHRRRGTGTGQLVGRCSACSTASGPMRTGAAGVAAIARLSHARRRGLGSGPIRRIDAGAGPVVVLLHGQPGAGGDWSALAEILSQRPPGARPRPSRLGRGPAARDGHRRKTPRRWRSCSRPCRCAGPADRCRALAGRRRRPGARPQHPGRVGALVLISSVGVAEAISGFDRLLAVPMLGSGIVRAGTAALWPRPDDGQALLPAPS